MKHLKKGPNKISRGRPILKTVQLVFAFYCLQAKRNDHSSTLDDFKAATETGGTDLPSGGNDLHSQGGILFFLRGSGFFS